MTTQYKKINNCIMPKIPLCFLPGDRKGLDFVDFTGFETSDSSF